MPIKVTCKCARSFAVKDEYAGKSCKCPQCGEVLRIPTPATRSMAAASSAMQVDSPSSMMPEAPQTRPCPLCKQPLPVEKIVCPYCQYSKRLGKKLGSSGFPPPVMKPVQSKPVPAVRPRKKSSLMTDSKIDWGTIAAGMAMMLGAVIWFGLGLAGGVIFVYAPILFIIGLFTSFKGLAGF